MRYQEIIDEYQMVPDPGFTMPDFTSGQQVGTINTGAGPLQVWKRVDQDQIGYAAVDPKADPATRLVNPASYLGFLVGQGLIVAKNALTDTAYQRKGISSELFLFVNQVEGHKILSDTQLTTGGEALWNSLIQSQKFNPKILYVPTSELFDLSDIGQAKASDGEMVQSPRTDSADQNVFNKSTGKGQRFFYLLENAQKVFVVEEHGRTFRFSVDASKHRTFGSILQPPRYFTNGRP
jgi:hypothetical protein